MSRIAANSSTPTRRTNAGARIVSRCWVSAAAVMATLQLGADPQ